MAFCIDSVYIADFLKEKNFEIAIHNNRKTNLIDLHEFSIKEKGIRYLVWTTKVHGSLIFIETEMDIGDCIRTKCKGEKIIKEAILQTPENKWDSIFEPIKFKLSNETVSEGFFGEDKNFEQELTEIFESKIIPHFEQNKMEEDKEHCECWLYQMSFLNNHYDNMIEEKMNLISHTFHSEKKGNRFYFSFKGKNVSIFEQKKKLTFLKEQMMSLGLKPKIHLYAK